MSLYYGGVLATSGVAERFDRAWLQKIVNELARLLCKPFGMSVQRVMEK